MSDDPLDRVRAICLAFPEASEGAGVGDPSFRVREKIFAMQHRMDGRSSVWCKAPPGAQQVLVGSDPQRFFRPPYVGQHGWIGFWLEAIQDWDEIAGLIEDSYRMTAPRRLARLLDQD